MANVISDQINTFHWHVTDSQSFPIEIPGFSDVSMAGAYSNSSIYSLTDVSDIISYAGEVRHRTSCKWMVSLTALLKTWGKRGE